MNNELLDKLSESKYLLNIKNFSFVTIPFTDNMVNWLEFQNYFFEWSLFLLLLLLQLSNFMYSKYCVNIEKMQLNF